MICIEYNGFKIRSFKFKTVIVICQFTFYTILMNPTNLKELCEAVGKLVKLLKLTQLLSPTIMVPAGRGLLGNMSQQVKKNKKVILKYFDPIGARLQALA